MATDNSIQIPPYLKNSRLLNQLSVRSLLKYWGIICIGVVFVLTIIALATNAFSSSKQKELNDNLIPVSNLIRNIKQNLFEIDDLFSDQNLNATNFPQQLIDGKIQGLQSELDQLQQKISTGTDMEYFARGIGFTAEQYFHEISAVEQLVNQVNPDNTSAISDQRELQNSIQEKISKIRNNKAELDKNLERLYTYVFSQIKSIISQSSDLGKLNLYILITAGFFVITIIVAGVTLIIYRISEPLGGIREAMHDLSTGDLGRRMLIKSEIQDEFTDLSKDFNQFAGKNEELFDEVTTAKDALFESERKTRAILENALVGIAQVRDYRFITVNKKFEEIFGYQRHQISKLNFADLYPSGNDYETVNSAAVKLMERGDSYQGEWRLRKNNGELFWCAVSAQSVSSEDINAGQIWLFEDISQRKKSEEELLHLANYDELTNLPNRSLFRDRLNQGMGRSQRKKLSLGLLYVDLDRFKKINDSLGHDAGDELLIIVAGILNECVRSSDTVCRLGGDEFTIILPEINDISDAGKVAEKIINIMSHPLDLRGNEISITPSIGISIFPEDATDFEALMKNADAAMYHAKSTGRNNYQYYSQFMNSLARDRLYRENRLRHALENDEYIIYYQPQIDTSSLEVTGYEALIRWKDAEHGITGPDKFIPLLEDTGMIVDVGEWIFRKVCEDIKELKNRNKHFKTVSVNISARQFLDNLLVKKIADIVSNTAVDTVNLTVEITETIMMTETELSLKILSELSGMGIQLSLDDFGTGYSSLAYLQRFPINALKIDKSFIQDIHFDKHNATICEAIITIGRQLGLKVVAEGVETREQFEFMRERGCTSIQGYYFGRPSPIDQLLSQVTDSA